MKLADLHKLTKPAALAPVKVVSPESVPVPAAPTPQPAEPASVPKKGLFAGLGQLRPSAPPAKPAPVKEPEGEGTVPDVLAELESLGDAEQAEPMAALDGGLDLESLIGSAPTLPDADNAVPQALADLRALKDGVEDSALVGQVLRNLLAELQTNPEFEELLAPHDLGRMIRAARSAHKVAVIQKADNKTKKAGGTGKKSGKAPMFTAEDLADLDLSGI